MKNSKYTLKATPNHSKKTFTIREYYKGKLFSKYRTFTMSKEEFEEEELNTVNDWKSFLKITNNYFLIK
jgi:hypothetical protein